MRYELTEVGDGNFAFILKPEMRSNTPAHYVCARCYQNGKASILQHRALGMSEDLLTCSVCDTKMLMGRAYRPPISYYEPDEAALEKGQ